MKLSVKDISGEANKPNFNARQLRFIEEYLIDLNGTQSAIRAGYSPKTANEQASRLLANVSLKTAIDERIALRSEETKITAKYVLETIFNTVERCQQAEPVMIRDGKDWIESGEYKFDSNAVLKGCELLGKHLKLFTDKVETDVKHSGELNHYVRPMEEYDALEAKFKVAIQKGK